MPYNTKEKAYLHGVEYRLKNKNKLKTYRDGRKKASKLVRDAYFLKNKDTLNEKRRNKYKHNNKECSQRALKHRNKKIEGFLDYIGSKRLHCDICKYDKSFAAIQFHHTDPSQKENSKDSFSKWVRKLSMVNFINKILTTDFMILCANCHAEIHAKKTEKWQ